MKICEIPECQSQVCEAGIPGGLAIVDERSHLCAGHAYALVCCIELNSEKQKRWFGGWTWEAPIDAFLNACRAIAEGHRAKLLEWRRQHPEVRA